MVCCCGWDLILVEISNIMQQPKEIIDFWFDICEKLWEREDLLSWSEHIMYVGRKIS